MRPRTVAGTEEASSGVSETEPVSEPKKTRGGPIDPRLITRAKATKGYMIAGVIVSCLMAVLIIFQAKLLSGSISGVFATHSMQGIGLTIGLLCLVLVGRGVLAWANSLLAERTAAAVKSQLRRDIIAARLTSPVNQTSTSSSLVTLVTQGLDALDGYFSKYLPQLLLAVTVPLIVGVAIVTSDWRSALIIAATIPFIPILMMLVGWNTEARVKKRWAYQARLASHFADLVAGLPTLQVFGRAKAQAQGLKRTEDANRSQTMGILRVAFLSAFVLELFSTVAVAVVALVIGTRLVYSQMDFSTALYVLILAPEVYLPIRQVGIHYHDSANGLAAAEAAFAEIDRGSAVSGDTDGSKVGAESIAESAEALVPSISIARLAYTYPDSDDVIGPFDLSVDPGQIVALAGHSGGGKTTIVNCIMGFLVPASGDVLLGGVPFAQVDFDLWRQGIAYVPQAPGMIDGTIADNVRLGYPDASDEDVRTMLDRAGAASLEQSRSVGEEGEGLSVGERRRVAIARALARIELGGARLLILDEPTAGLDSDTEAKVLLALKESGATALVVSHREAVMDAADKVVHIGDVRGEEQPVDGLQADVPAAPSDVAVGIDSEGTEESVGVVAADQESEPNPVTEQHHRGSPLMKLVLSLLDAVPRAKLRLIAAILLAAAASGAAIGLMGVSAWLISKAAEHPAFLELSVAAVGVRFFGISRGVFRYVERLVGHDIALRMQSALRLKTYQALARTTLLGKRQGDLLVRVVSDVSAIDDVVVRIVQPFVSAVVVVLTVCAVMLRFSVGASLIVLVSAVVGGIVVPWLAARISRQADRQAVPLRGELGIAVHDISRTAVDLASYGAVDTALDRVATVDMALRRTEEKMAWASGMGSGLQTIASGIGFIGCLWIGAVGVCDGSIGERLLAVLVLMAMSLHEVFVSFSQAAQTMTRAKVALDRVEEILEAPPVGRGDAQIRPADEEPSVTCDDLTIGWPGNPPVAWGLSLGVHPGEATGVMGPSGVGKTTLAATIMGLIPPVSGELSTQGRIGYLAQDAHIFATTVAENVRIGNKDASDDDVGAALREAGLDIDPARVVGEMGATLSGGEARRLALARLFVGNYRLLILDEPTEHLDRPTADALMDDVFSTLASRPLLVISHDESVMARCDDVLKMG